MKITGVIVEHNPLHNGHVHHLQQAREITGADCVIAVMSGLFMQRGEPSILHPSIRTGLMLANGADIVVELPYPYATAEAETFAHGAVSILSQLNCTSLVFGSETNHLEHLIQQETFCLKHATSIDREIKTRVQSGISWRDAREEAIRELVDGSFPVSFSPNDVLGGAYIRAILNTNRAIQPVSIARL
ncbi:MAG: nucleotidyltransferase family protein, partial [Bacilli bacterium]